MHVVHQRTGCFEEALIAVSTAAEADLFLFQ